jgi:hypothetical protein
MDGSKLFMDEICKISGNVLQSESSSGTGPLRPSRPEFKAPIITSGAKSDAYQSILKKLEAFRSRKAGIR